MKTIFKKFRALFAIIAAGLVVVLLSSCAGFSAFGENLNRAFSGVSATLSTYNQEGQLVDEVHGKSFQISRDTRFDSKNSEGGSNADSSVLMISLGDSHISHVGSTLVLAEDGIIDVTESIGTEVSFENSESGVPWLNNLIEYNRNLWQGKGKTLMVRSQDGTPVAVFVGDEVEVFATDVPKSTWFRIDGKYLLVYRADYTMYDNDLLVANG